MSAVSPLALGINGFSITVPRGLNLATSDVASLLTPYLQHQRTKPKAQSLSDSQRALRSADVLIGAQRMRPRGWQPTAENKTALQETLAGITKETPISCVTMSGSAKHIALTDRMFADLGELLWFERFAGLDRSLREFHPGGLRINILLEDFGRRYLGGTTSDMELRMKLYHDSLLSLAKVIAPGVILPQLESEVFSKRRVSESIAKRFPQVAGEFVDWPLFEALADSLFEKFYAYLCETEERGIVPQTGEDAKSMAAHQKLESFQALQSTGFSGCVPQIQRDYYTGRASNCSGQSLCQEAARQRIARYLGAAFARHQLGLLEPLKEKSESGPDFLKLSLVRHAPGCPTSLQRNRLEYVVNNRSKKSCRAIAPWCGSGVIDGRGHKPRISMMSVKELSNRQVETGSIVIEGETPVTLLTDFVRS